jgi:hypothetical protein
MRVPPTESGGLDMTNVLWPAIALMSLAEVAVSGDCRHPEQTRKLATNSKWTCDLWESPVTSAQNGAEVTEATWWAL